MGVITGDNEPKKFCLDREREQLPICNQSTGARNLFTDEVIQRSQREIQEEIRPPRYEFAYAVMLFIILFLTFGAFVVIAEVFSPQIVK
jgi:hypothetical protein